MATKSKQVEVANITIEIDMDEFTWGDLEDMESRSPRLIRGVMEKFAKVDGVEDVGGFLRTLSLNQFQQLSAQFQEAVTEATNPVGKNGKN